MIIQRCGVSRLVEKERWSVWGSRIGGIFWQRRIQKGWRRLLRAFGNDMLVLELFFGTKWDSTQC